MSLDKFTLITFLLIQLELVNEGAVFDQIVEQRLKKMRRAATLIDKERAPEDAVRRFHPFNILESVVKREGAYANNIVKFCGWCIDELAQTESACESTNVIQKPVPRGPALAVVWDNWDNLRGRWIPSASGALANRRGVFVGRRSFEGGHCDFFKNPKMKTRWMDKATCVCGSDDEKAVQTLWRAAETVGGRAGRE